jgi:membrane protease YdiL (CAAX protease family)
MPRIVVVYLVVVRGRVGGVVPGTMVVVVLVGVGEELMFRGVGVGAAEARSARRSGMGRAL